MLQAKLTGLKRLGGAIVIATLLLFGSASTANVLNGHPAVSPVVVADGGGSANPPCSC